MQVEIITDRERWNRFVEAQPTGNITQTYEWGELPDALGGDALRLARKEPRGDQRERAAGLPGGQQGDPLRQVGEPAAFRGEDRAGAGGHRGGNELAAVDPAPGQRGEQRAGPQLARIERQVPHIDVRVA